jgi:DtxR family Mn-dependent transcriptional regulator
LGYPDFDPHGDPIPNRQGEIKKTAKLLLSEAELQREYRCVGVKDSSSEFLKYLDKQKIALGSVFKVIEKESFDDTLTVEINAQEKIISNKIANNLYVQ